MEATSNLPNNILNSFGDKAGRAAVKIGVAGFCARYAWNTVIELEDRQAQEEAEWRVGIGVQNASTPTSASEVLKLTEKEKIIEKSAPFSKAEESVKQQLREATNQILASYKKIEPKND